jgi:hypothetical protein
MAGNNRTEKMSVTLPGKLAGEIRSIAAQGEISAFFTEALEHYLAYRKQADAFKKGFGAWSDDNHPELATSGDSTAYVRAGREADKKRLLKTGGGRDG